MSERMTEPPSARAKRSEDTRRGSHKQTHVVEARRAQRQESARRRRRRHFDRARNPIAASSTSTPAARPAAAAAAARYFFFSALTVFWAVISDDCAVCRPLHSPLPPESKAMPSRVRCSMNIVVVARRRRLSFGRRPGRGGPTKARAARPLTAANPAERHPSPAEARARTRKPATSFRHRCQGCYSF